jgi:chromosome partitioning protein
MQTIVIASRKGGAGKTTHSISLSVAAELQGFGPVALVDLDEQGSAAAWWNARKPVTPVFARVEVPALREHLNALEKAGVRLVIIDTPPGNTPDVRSVVQAAIGQADLVLIPTRPSPLDLRSLGVTIDLCNEARKPMVFVINGAANQAAITAKVAIELSQHGCVSPVTTFQRTVFATSAIDGRTVQEVEPEGKSAQEVGALWEYVARQLERNVERAAA